MLAAIPWVGRDLAARNADALDALLGIIEEYIKTRKTTHKDMIKVFLKGEKEYLQVLCILFFFMKYSSLRLQTDSLELMWRQVQDLRVSNNIMSHSVNTFFSSRPRDGLRQRFQGLIFISDKI